jgi:hypothetical protein
MVAVGDGGLMRTMHIVIAGRHLGAAGKTVRLMPRVV